jgi:hypothetical protein
VRPEHSGPVASVIAPNGRPPPSIASMEAIPVAVTVRIVRGKCVSAEGIRLEREASIWLRMEAAEGMGYSPYVRLDYPSRQIRNA